MFGKGAFPLGCITTVKCHGGNTDGLDHLCQFSFLLVNNCFSAMSPWSVQIVLGVKGIVSSNVRDAYYLKIELSDGDHPINQLVKMRADDNDLRMESLGKIRKLTRENNNIGWHKRTIPEYIYVPFFCTPFLSPLLRLKQIIGTICHPTSIRLHRL